MNTFRRLKQGSCIAALLSFAASAVSAEVVTLRSTENGVELVGEIVLFDSVTYVIDTSIGRLNVLAEQSNSSARTFRRPMLVSMT